MSPACAASQDVFRPMPGKAHVMWNNNTALWLRYPYPKYVPARSMAYDGNWRRFHEASLVTFQLRAHCPAATNGTRMHRGGSLLSNLHCCTIYIYIIYHYTTPSLVLRCPCGWCLLKHLSVARNRRRRNTFENLEMQNGSAKRLQTA